MHKGPSSSADNLRTTPDNHIHNAALVGASNALARRTATPPAVPHKGDAALLAASLAGKKLSAELRDSSSKSNRPYRIGGLVDQNTGSAVSQRTSLPSPAVATGSARLNGRTVPDRDRAVSDIAATTAPASKIPDTQPRRPTSPLETDRRPLHQPNGQALTKATFDIPIVTLHQASPLRAERWNGMDSEQGGTDDTPIAPTTSLVKLFEQNKEEPQRGYPSPPLKSKLPATPPGKPAAAKPKSKISPRLEALRHRQQYDEAVAVKEAAAAAAADAAAIELRGRPPIRGKPSLKRSSSAAAAATATTVPSLLKAKPELPPPRRSGNKPIPPPVNEPAKPALVKQPTPPRSQPIHIRKTSSNLSLPEAFSRSSLSPNPNHYQQRSIRQISPHMTGESLANAIVGASLASRQTSPHRSGTPASLPALPTRNQRHQHVSHNPLHFRTRSNSPSKSTETTGTQRVSLRTTLRKDESSSSDEGRGKQGKGRKHRFRKHPNKHHEGDRKRWRDTITERERRRYEGLWAANKALYVSLGASPLASGASPSVATEDVLDLVVREIWSRSRLPLHVLAEIWDLVDHRGQHRLTREEFVVGTWLVDQCLKGRKVPSRVMDSVWTSVRLMGVKVRKKNFQ